jgi:AraC-like DNA-binding protein
MHLRTSTKKTANKTYRYVQIVESYRRDDGVPTKRVVAHLGALPQPLIDTLRQAFKAASTGDALVLRSEVAEMLSGSTLANRRYLDLAVLIDCWRKWRLSQVLDELAGDQATSVSFSEVVLPLVLQRCCEPRSKLEATRWVPTTALPDVLGFDVAAFHNSRIHRSMETLYEVTATLQQRLCERYSSQGGDAGVLFMDVTDTYFEGIGCPMAEQTKTKSELPHKRCLGIVLLANGHGYPMRWKVVGGKSKDWHAMGGLLDDIGKVDWLQNRPIIFDRAMGNQTNVAALKNRELYFLTAAHVSAIESYTKTLPFDAFKEVELEGTDESYEQDIDKVAKAARKAELEEIHPRLFALELGVALPASEQEKAEEKASPRRRRGPRSRAAKHLRQADAIRRQLEADPKLTLKDVAASLGISTTHLANQMALLHLAPGVQKRILQWDDHLPFGEKYLRSLLGLEPKKQLATLDKAIADHLSAMSQAIEPADDEESIGPLRLVAYFNPRLFIDIRRRTAEHCEKLQRHVKDFNADLASAKRSRGFDATYRRFAREVERLNYLDTFDIALTPITVTSKTGHEIASFRGSITRKEDVWKRRRRYDGFVLLLGHPELPQSAKELVSFYRIKDTVEKDFQTIKSLIKLRPIYSYTDPKVQAHVTVCMLALLVQRTLERRLRSAGLPLTAPACIDLLKSCHLNQRRSDDEPLYDITHLDAAQQQILSALGLEQLADDEHLRAVITPRCPVPSASPKRKQGRRTRRQRS